MFEGRLFWMMEGLVVIEFDNGIFRVSSHDDSPSDDDEPSPASNLAFTNWNAREDGTLKKWTACTKVDISEIMKVDKWTSQVYSRLNKLEPYK